MFKKIQKWGNPNKNCNISSGKGMCQRNSCLSWLTNNKKRFLSFPSPHPFRHIPLLPSFVLSLNDFLLHCGHYGLLEGSFISSLRSAGYRGKWRGALSPKRWGIIFLWQQVKETKQVDLGCTSSKVPAANTDYKGRTTEGAVITPNYGSGEERDKNITGSTENGFPGRRRNIHNMLTSPSQPMDDVYPVKCQQPRTHLLRDSVKHWCQ